MHPWETSPRRSPAATTWPRSVVRWPPARSCPLACTEALRPAVLAAVLSEDASPQAVLVVVAGARGAEDFARDLGLFVGTDRVLVFPDFEGFVWDTAAPDPAAAGARARALWWLGGGALEGSPAGDDRQAAEGPRFVVVSSRSLIRRIAHPRAGGFEPVRLAVGMTAPPLQDRREAGPDGLRAPSEGRGARGVLGARRHPRCLPGHGARTRASGVLRRRDRGHPALRGLVAAVHRAARGGPRVRLPGPAFGPGDGAGRPARARLRRSSTPCRRTASPC